MEKSKRRYNVKNKLVFQSSNALEHLEKKKFQLVELGIDKVCQCISDGKKVKEIQWKEFYFCPIQECIGTLGEKEIYK